MNFADFVVTAEKWGLRSAWVYEPGIAIYTRRPMQGVRPEGVDFDLADMTADHPGRGSLTRFLDRYEPRHGFYVENILNERLIGYLERRGYRRFCRYPGVPDICMIRPREGAPWGSSGASPAGSDSIARSS